MNTQSTTNSQNNLTQESANNNANNTENTQESNQHTSNINFSLEHYYAKQSNFIFSQNLTRLESEMLLFSATIPDDFFLQLLDWFANLFLYKYFITLFKTIHFLNVGA